MKIISSFLLSYFFCFGAIAQDNTNKIKLEKDKEFEIVSKVKTSGSLTGVEISLTSNVNSLIQISETNDKNYKIKTKIVKLKINGQSDGGTVLVFDSENIKTQKPGRFGYLIDKLDYEKDFSVDRKTGEITDLSTSDEDKFGIEIEKLMNVDGSESASINNMFLLIPKGKKVGDSWTITIESTDNKTEIVYNLKEIKDGIAFVDFKSIVNLKQTSNARGNDYTIILKLNSNGTIEVNTNTGILQKKTTANILEGTTESMGDSSPIKLNTSIVKTYTQK